ncbi:hypothetical protein P8452_16736 [Trifolium repens]|nr:hypothetical protein P8452_16736 [Trifolium repens]
MRLPLTETANRNAKLVRQTAVNSDREQTESRCKSGIQSSDATCHNNRCSYTLQYGDVNGITSGYYVSDTIHLDTIFEGSVASYSSAPVVFGCSNQRSGDFTKSDRALDGVFESIALSNFVKSPLLWLLHLLDSQNNGFH